MPLPPFDSEALCPKCLHDDVSVSYQDGRSYDCMKMRHDDVGSSVGHFHRHCRRCHYEWAEATLDTKVDA